jgi:hypothetical protein
MVLVIAFNVKENPPKLCEDVVSGSGKEINAGFVVKSAENTLPKCELIILALENESNVVLPSLSLIPGISVDLFKNLFTVFQDLPGLMFKFMSLKKEISARCLASVNC